MALGALDLGVATLQRVARLPMIEVLDSVPPTRPVTVGAHRSQASTVRIRVTRRAGRVETHPTSGQILDLHAQGDASRLTVGSMTAPALLSRVGSGEGPTRSAVVETLAGIRFPGDQLESTTRVLRMASGTVLFPLASVQTPPLFQEKGDALVARETTVVDRCLASGVTPRAIANSFEVRVSTGELPG